MLATTSNRFTSRVNLCRQPAVASNRPCRLVCRAAVDVQELKDLKEDLKVLIAEKSCNPIVIRLAWHDSGSYNKDSGAGWPRQGGATGSIRFKPEITHEANAGLENALDLLAHVKDKYPSVSFADVYQMASGVAIELAGGPKIPLRYGRKDSRVPDDCATEGNLPAAGGPFKDGSKKPGDHLRRVFARMGLTDKDIVALSGAHTLGRSRPDRSGWGKASTKYTEKGPGSPGGQSWTVNWLTFDNSYFTDIKEQRDADLLVLPTDAALFEDEGFRPFAEKYAADQDAFFADYSESHVKLSELGAEWVEGAPITL